ncbi:MAG: AAA family ATPase [Pseudomonadota bacterium]
MRLTGFFINGFGIFHNLKIEGLSPEFTLILGQNESGKSTLLGFFRAILFGFPDGRSSDNPYPPVAGGQHGGNMILLTGDGRKHVVERGPGPRRGKVSVHEPGQGGKGLDILNRLLGTANKILFNNIYAFSLSELQSFETLNMDSIRETLYSAGAGVNSARLLTLRSFLEKKENTLFRPGGTKPKINAILSRLSAIQKEKKALFGSVDQYDQIQSRISRLAEEIHAMEQRKLEKSMRQKKIDQWINIWPDWINLSVAETKLEQTEIIDFFPYHGLSRLEGLKMRIQDLEDDLYRKEEDLKRQEAGFSSLEIDSSLLDQKASIRILQTDLGHFEAMCKELLSLNQEVAQLEKKTEDGLRRLGPQWSEKWILEFDLSITARERIRGYRELLSRAELELQRKGDLIEIQLNKKKEIEDFYKDLPHPPSEDTEELSRKLNACKGLLFLGSQRSPLREELRHTQARREDIQEEASLIEKPLPLKESHLPLWFIPAITISGSLILIWFGLKNGWDWSLLIGVVFMCVAISSWFFLAKFKGLRKAREMEVQQRIDHLSSKLETLKNEETRIALQMSEIDKQSAPALDMLSLDDIPSEGSLEEVKTDLSNRIGSLDKWLNAKKALEHAIKMHQEAEKALEYAKSEAQLAEDRWLEWLKERGLDPDLSPDGALEALSLIETCREQVHYLNQIRAKIESLENTKGHYISMANAALLAGNREGVRDEEVLIAVHDLIRDFLEAEQAFQKKDLLMNEVKVSQASIERLRGQISELKQEITSLMESGGAKDEDLFIKRAETFEKRRSLKDDMERSEDNIRRLTGIQGEIDPLLDKLSVTSLEELEKDKIRLERDLSELDVSLDYDKREQARLEEQARQLINDERISILRSEEESLKEELALFAEEWSVARFAGALIRMSRARYERERQPEVIREAGHFFQQLTLGRYPSIVAPIDQGRIEVICQDNSRKEIGQLSRGTAEQLFLSLRFGFIREFSKTSESLPIIMDEILVNFDPLRAKAAVKAILELSRQNQILFFTCHPQTAMLFREEDPRLPVLEISDGGIKKWNN